MNTFQPFPKMARLSREIVITEKIDGTNAQIFIWDICATDPTSRTPGSEGSKAVGAPPEGIPWVFEEEGLYVAVGSRNRWITPEADNYGFARWVKDNAAELWILGHGRHFGEWWGKGIQRGYGVPDKRFSLFNVGRWCLHNQTPGPKQEVLPACVGLVPVLYRGPFLPEPLHSSPIDLALNDLECDGSVAAPGFMDPEGIVIWHTAAQVGFKKTIKDDESPKSLHV